MKYPCNRFVFCRKIGLKIVTAIEIPGITKKILSLVSDNGKNNLSHLKTSRPSLQSRPPLTFLAFTRNVRIMQVA